MAWTKHAAAAINNRVFGKTSDLDTAPTLSVGLSSTDPGTDGSGITEPSGNGYARQAADNTKWGTSSAAHPSVIANSSAFSFGPATADWLSADDIAYFFLADDESPSNVWASAALTTAKPVLDGDTLTFAIGDLTESES